MLIWKHAGPRVGIPRWLVQWALRFEIVAHEVWALWVTYNAAGIERSGWGWAGDATLSGTAQGAKHSVLFTAAFRTWSENRPYRTIYKVKITFILL